MMKIGRALCVCFVMLFGVSLAHANNDIWKSAVNGIWTTNSNWIDGSYPTGNDQATFDRSGGYKVTFLFPRAGAHDLFVFAGSVELGLRLRTVGI